MKKKFTAIFSLMLAIVMLTGALTAFAADSKWQNIFGEGGKAYGTKVEYVDDIGMYVAVGKGLYTSADGINWSMRGGGLADMRSEYYGFAYGGPRNAKYFLLLSKSTSTGFNKTFAVDKYFASRETIYSYTDSGEALGLKGVLEWDEFTQKFWCGAALADGTKAGLYYSAGYSWNNETSKNEMKWTKADCGTSALFAEATPYTSTLDAMVTVLTSITSDEKGHIVAYGRWTETLKSTSDSANTLINGAGGKACQSALLVDASGETVQTQLCDFSKFSTGSGISTAVIDKKSNVYIEDSTYATLLAFYTGTFSKLWTLGNNGQATIYSSSNPSGVMNAIKYAVEPNAYNADSYPKGARVVINSNKTNVLNKIVSFDDKALLIPRAGQGVGGNNALSDIFVVTYAADGTPKNRYTTFINDTDTAAKAIGDYVNGKVIHFVTDAAEGPDGRVVLMTGKNTKNIAAVPTYATTVTVLDTKNTVTDSTATETPERSSKVTFGKTSECAYTYSHIQATDTNVNVKPNSSFALAAKAYDGTTYNIPVEADITYKLIGEAPAGFDENIDNGEIFVYEECEPGTYKIEVEAALTSDPEIKNVITYTVNVVGDFVTSLNGVYNYDAECGKSISGLSVGKNIITAECFKETGENDVAIIAVYKGADFVGCEYTKGSSATLNFTISQESDPEQYSYKIMFWSQSMKPL